MLLPLTDVSQVLAIIFKAVEWCLAASLPTILTSRAIKCSYISFLLLTEKNPLEHTMLSLKLSSLILKCSCYTLSSYIKFKKIKLIFISGKLRTMLFLNLHCLQKTCPIGGIIFRTSPWSKKSTDLRHHAGIDAQHSISPIIQLILLSRINSTSSCAVNSPK